MFSTAFSRFVVEKLGAQCGDPAFFWTNIFNRCNPFDYWGNYGFYNPESEQQSRLNYNVQALILNLILTQFQLPLSFTPINL